MTALIQRPAFLAAPPGCPCRLFQAARTGLGSGKDLGEPPRPAADRQHFTGMAHLVDALALSPSPSFQNRCNYVLVRRLGRLDTRGGGVRRLERRSNVIR